MNIPNDNHVIRHIPHTKLLRDDEGNPADEHGNPYGVYPQAFELREIDKNKLSVNWVEKFNNDTQSKNIEETIESIRRVRGIKKTASCGFAIGKVSNIKAVSISRDFSRVNVVFSGSNDNPSHSSIIRLPDNDIGLMTDFAEKVFTEIILNNP